MSEANAKVMREKFIAGLGGALLLIAACRQDRQPRAKRRGSIKEKLDTVNAG